MKAYLKSGAVLAAMLAAGAAQAASGLPYSSLYVFGDSLVDSGNILAITGGTRGSVAEGYAGGRFSNGYNFADYLALDLTGAPATAYLGGGGRNFAYGGAQAAPSTLPPGSPPTPPTPPTLTQQVAQFVGSASPRIDPNALVLVTIGGNDVREFVTRPALAPSATATFAALTTSLTQLIGLGARNIVVTGLPDIGTIPATLAVAATYPEPIRSQLIAQISGASFAYNEAFRGIAAQADADPLAQVTFFDFAAYQRALVADPAAYGFAGGLNSVTPCITVPAGAVDTSCTDAQGRQQVFYDAIHPTTEIHAAVAGGIIRSIYGAVPEPASWAMMIAGFGLVGAAMRRPTMRVRLG